MKLVVLNDDRAGRFRPEHGLSFLIETDENKVLFDTGPSAAFLENATSLGINLYDVDCIVLSHGHYDHGNGLSFIRHEKNLVCHPGCFTKRYDKSDSSYVGLSTNLEEAKRSFRLVLSKEPYEISKNVIFLGEIPRGNDFESKTTEFCTEGKQDDFIIDDSALAVKSEKGLVVFAGCSHAGICNIMEYAKQVTGVSKVYAVVGGFHLRALDEVALKTIEYLRKEKLCGLYPAHCTCDAVMKKLTEGVAADSALLHSGDVLEF